MSVRYANSPSDLPPGEHFVILSFSSIYIPGDERSRTHPGHGYPEHTETTVSCAVYSTKDEWIAAIKAEKTRPRGYNSTVPMIVRVPSLKTEVVVDV